MGSPNHRIAVVGANGKTGRAVTGVLRTRGVAVRGIGRSQMSDLIGAFEGCDCAYLVAPNMHPDEPGFAARALIAAGAAGVRHIVYHSVASPYVPAMPHHLGKAIAEDLVRRGPCAWTILQPCAYVQNFTSALRATEPTLRVAYDPARTFGLVDLDDVAGAAAAVMLDGHHHGATYELGGPALVSVVDVAVAAGTVLGQNVGVERVTREQWAATDGANLDLRVRDWLLAMFDYYDDHGLPAGPLPLQALLGRPATPLADALARIL